MNADSPETSPSNGCETNTENSPPTPTLPISTLVKRIPITQSSFDQLHLKTNREKTSLCDSVRSRCFCSKTRLWKCLNTYIPIIKVIRYYKLKEYLLIDMLAGITIGIMHIPQALGFGMLASVKTVNGLYTSFWPIVIYMLFGTSAHVSIGTSAVICILTASVVDKQALNFIESWGNGTSSDIKWELVPEYMDFKEGVAMTTSLLAGFILLIMGICRLGFITAYLSESFFSAFTSGAAVHIATSQVANMFGLSVQKYSGPFKIIYTYRDLFLSITSINFAELIISFCAIVALLLVKSCINDRFRHRLKVPIPIELIVVIVGTAVSYLGNLSANYDVKIVGTIVTEMPMPTLPPLEHTENIIVDSFIIAILIFANTIAMAKICAKKHNYEVDDSQELIAYGLCNFLSAFMYCFPSSIAPPRSMVASSMGVKTSLNAIFTSILMLLVLTVISSLFESLPKAILSAVIVVALHGLFVQISDIRKYWNINIFDFIIWVATFTGVVFLDIDYGLGIGVCISLITVVLQTQFASGYRLGHLVKEGMLVEHKLYNSKEAKGIKVFRFESNIYFATAEIFRGLLYRKTLNPRKLLKQLQKQKKRLLKQQKKDQRSAKPRLSSMDLLRRNDTDSTNSEVKPQPQNSNQFSLCNLQNPVFSLSLDDQTCIINKTSTSPLPPLASAPVSFLSSGRPISANGDVVVGSMGKNLTNGRRISSSSSLESSIVCIDEVDPDDGDVLVTEEKLNNMKSVHHIILDFSSVNYIDASGANVLNHIHTEYGHVNIKVFFAGCHHSVRDLMRRAGVLDHYPSQNIFVALSDAVAQARIEIVDKHTVDLSDFSDDEAAEDSYVTKL